MKKIEIEVVPHKEQRYETVGDWFYRKDADLASGRMNEVLVIRVSDLGDWRYNALVAIHELVEVVLCKQRGISQAAVDQFDIEFERRRKKNDLSEPGDSVQAPYRAEHCAATGVERLLAAQLGVDWEPYEAKINSL